MWHNLFICSSLQMRLVNWFLQVGKHFGFYELSNDRLSGNSFLASFWSSSKKSIKFWFAGLETSRWNLGFAVAIDWSFTCFLRNRIRISPKYILSLSKLWNVQWDTFFWFFYQLVMKLWIINLKKKNRLCYLHLPVFYLLVWTEH